MAKKGLPVSLQKALEKSDLYKSSVCVWREDTVNKPLLASQQLLSCRKLVTQYRQEGHKMVPIYWDFPQENRSIRWVLICAHRRSDASGLSQVLSGTDIVQQANHSQILCAAWL